MTDYKLDDSIPIPNELPEELVIPEDLDLDEDNEDPEIPGKRGRKPRCRSNNLHAWEPYGLREGHEREKCSKCGDIFPCMNKAKCWHYDCWEARGETHPWIADGTMIQSGNILSINDLALEIK